MVGNVPTGRPAVLNWNTIGSAASYRATRSDLLVLLEGATSKPYLDVVGDATIGIGFNLKYNLSSVLTAIVGKDHDATTLLDRLQAVVDADYASGQTALLQKRLDAVMKTWHDSRDSAVPVSFAFANSGQISAALTAIAPTYDGYVDRWLSGIPNSTERAVLFSLAYNSPSLLGPSLKAAILEGDRAEAWYEIRYNSNGNKIAGIANRRYVEAERFQLFDTEDTCNTKQALEAGAMYAAHRDKILSYESLWSPTNAAAIKGEPGIETILDELSPAIARLKLTYKLGSGLALEELQVAGGALTTLKGDGTSHDSAANDADLLVGSAAADRLEGGNGNDALIGNAGNDRLYGGNGNDWLQGGAGADQLFGGAGRDTFDFNALSDSRPAQADVISGFVSGQDRIDLSHIDGNGVAAGHAFSFLATEGAAFTHHAGELKWSQTGTGSSARTIIEGDVNGDAAADLKIVLSGHHDLTASDFLL